MAPAGGRAFGASGPVDAVPASAARHGHLAVAAPLRHDEAFEKRYVTVVTETDREGQVTPLRIIWGDGRSFFVDEVLDVRWTKSPCSPRRVQQYTVRILERSKKLYYENPRWFVQAKLPRHR